MNNLNSTTDGNAGGGKPFFSIIIPVYNAESYLRECLESLISQDFQDWEAVLVDDCSSDTSVSIAEEYSTSDSRIRLFRSHSNSGSAYAPRLQAARLARADYVVTVDADDKVSSDLLSQLHKGIITYGADLVIPELWRMEKESTHKIMPTKKIDVDKIWVGKELIWYTLVDWDIPMCGFAARRDLYLDADVNVSNENRKSIFSDELHSRWLLFICGKVTFCNARYFYRNNEASVTNVNLPRIIASRMHTCDGLIAMTSTAFGEDSPTYFRALENKLYSAAGNLRLINRSSLNRRLKREAEQTVALYMKGFDMRPLKGKTSPRYLALMSLPVALARISLKIIDSLIRKNDGI
ncbi:MAG: glycosyltransferase [Muribaculaceae bacterium]|nr:glycosyltransferase [Muribaculaceae bacterium]